MGFFNRTNKDKANTTTIGGYEIDDTGCLINCPRGLEEYTIPEGVKSVSDSAFNVMKGTALQIIMPTTLEEFNDHENRFLSANPGKIKKIIFQEGTKFIQLYIKRCRI